MSNATHGGKGDRDRTDRSKYENNWDKVFGRKEEQISEEGAALLADVLEKKEEINTTENFARKMREWNMMYDCLQNMHLYEYPIEEVKQLLKQIKVS
jgi:hypothetical protein|tara:strand:+ start:802 stop:1092 length:291 start_codon:yes stop_codon:yes gene_type:complete